MIISQNFGMFTYILGINLFKNDYFQTEITFCFENNKCVPISIGFMYLLKKVAKQPTTERPSTAILNKIKVFYKIFNLKVKIKIEKKINDKI